MGSFIHVYTDGGGIREARVPDDYSGLGSQPFVVKFPGFRKSLLASLVANSTASRTSDIVTVTATAHGITTGTTYVGFRFFYPGSAGLTAGWYDSIVSIPDANTITFNAPGANFGSESVNGGAAYTTLTTISGQCIIPGGLLTDNNVVRVAVPGGGGLTGATKSIRPVINSTGLHTATATGFPFNIREWEIFSILSNSLACAFIQYNGASSSFTTVAVDKSQDIAVQFQASVSAAADFVTLHTPPRAIIY
jgi:hypothetical protein